MNFHTILQRVMNNNDEIHVFDDQEQREQSLYMFGYYNENMDRFIQCYYSLYVNSK